MKAFVIHNDEWAFFPIEKCASNSIFRVLTSDFGWNAVGLGGDYWETSPPPNLQPMLYAYATQYKSLAVHRNPYDRMVSTWWAVTHDARDTNQDILAEVGSDEFLPFVQWVVQLDPNSLHGRRSIYRPQTTWLKAVPIEKWLRFEHLTADFIDLPFSRNTVLPRLNKTDREHWTAHYGGEAAELVVRWAAWDFELFEYSYAWMPEAAKSS